MQVFDPASLKDLYTPPVNSSKNQNGLVTIIGGSKLFHGAPLMAVSVASKIVDMVFFSSPEPSLGEIANKIKSKLFSFIWIPWEETNEYIKKSDSILIGPGFMRFREESNATLQEFCDEACRETKEITKDFLTKFPDKKWVIDAGSLQVLDPTWIPENCVLTPNRREYKMIFGVLKPEEAAKKYKCIIVIKGPSTFVYSSGGVTEVKGGNAGLTKGGTGDIQAGLTAALLAKNDPVLAASSAAYVVKASADRLYKKVGTVYNAEDLAAEIPTLFFPQKMRYIKRDKR